jgi:uncharacterized C2H2 Zn-finger protein
VRRKDPTGKRALFEAGHGGDLTGPDGKDALFHTTPPEGDVLLHCSRCEAESVLTLADAAVRLMSLSIWVPGRQHSHRLRCPACGQRSWVRLTRLPSVEPGGQNG